MTKMDLVAELLGVELGEDFNIQCRGECVYTNQSPFSLLYFGLCDNRGVICNDILISILMGTCEIKKMDKEW